MKKILLLALPLMAMCFVSCEKDNKWTDDSPIIQFKDPYFLEAILEASHPIDRNADGQISEKEASVATILEVSSNNIRNIDEIRYFTALTRLYCGTNQLTSLDVSNNAALTELYCFENQLTELDLSNNTALTSLNCDSNQLTTLDLSNNKALKSLDCKKNPLKKIILYKYHMLSGASMKSIEEEYGDIIEYVE